MARWLALKPKIIAFHKETLRMNIVKSETVIVTDPDVPSNGSTEHAAIVTAVQGNQVNPLINAKVFPDGGQFYNAFSVYHRDEREPGYAGPTWHRREDRELPAEHPTTADEDVAAKVAAAESAVDESEDEKGDEA